MGFPGDCDPRDEAFEPECKCGDLLVEDMFGEWFCPSCVDEKNENERLETNL